MNTMNMSIQRNGAGYGRTCVFAAVPTHARAYTRVRGIDGVDFAAVSATRPATAKGPRTWSPPNT